METVQVVEVSASERHCSRCKGARKVFWEGFTATSGTVYPDKWVDCTWCDGIGKYSEPNVEEIEALVLATKGKNKGKLRASMKSSDNARAYYVWRMARFHGGVDVTLPVMADLGVRGDPYRKELDQIAEDVAKKYLGSNMRGAMRWHQAMFG